GRAEYYGEEARAGAGVRLSALSREAAALNLGGIECLVGIPATIGGALAMNAGTADGWIGDFVSAVYYLHPDGALGEFKPSGEFGYRAFHLPAGAVLIGCRLQLHRRPLPEIQKEIRARLKQKKATQPLALASARFVWNNPASASAPRAGARAGPAPSPGSRAGPLSSGWCSPASRRRWPARAGPPPRRASRSPASRCTAPPASPCRASSPPPPSCPARICGPSTAAPWPRACRRCRRSAAPTSSASCPTA